VISGVSDRLAKLIDDNMRGTINGVTHTEVYEVGACLAFCLLQGIQTRKQIWRQSRYSL
jgi:hypothetical protein